MTKDREASYVAGIIFIIAAGLFSVFLSNTEYTEDKALAQREYVRLLELRHDLMVPDKPPYYSKRFDEIRETCSRKFWFIIDLSLPNVIPDSYADHYKKMTGECMQIYFKQDADDMEKLREINER